MAKHSKRNRRPQTDKERLYERELLELILRHTVGSQPRTRPAAHVRLRVSDGRRDVGVEFRTGPPTPQYPWPSQRDMKRASLYRPTPTDIRRQFGEFDD